MSAATLVPMRRAPRASDLAAALDEAHARELRLREAMERIAAHAAAMQADADAASAEQLGFSYIRARALQALEKSK